MLSISSGWCQRDHTKASRARGSCEAYRQLSRPRGAAREHRQGHTRVGGAQRVAGAWRPIKDHPEECLALVTCQIRPVRGAHHTVAKAVCRTLELDGKVRLLRPVKSPSTLEDVID